MSAGSFTIRAKAARDLSRQAAWLREQAGADMADRFLNAALASFARVANSPGLGGSAQSRVGELADAGRWRVEGFPNHLIFYVRRPRDGVTILRILRSAQDWKQP